MKAKPKTHSYTLVLVFYFLFSCKNTTEKIITVKNTLDIPRQFETVEIHKSDLKVQFAENFEKLSVRDLKTQTNLISQFVDEDQDGRADVLLFQPELDPNSEKQFELLELSETDKPEVTDYCYSRFVPERTDDYAWENNKVGFRTFGPTAQKMVEDSIKGGTLTSGIDAWLKRVEYPIINKWYKKAETEPNSYHKDHGEGLDNFHVGKSRGVGGIAVKVDTTYYTSKNFTNYKTITTGPIRTSFVLEYADWDAKGNMISETKHISLDFGSNLSRFEVDLNGTSSIHTGLALHEKEGETAENKEAGWISYWEPIDDSQLGLGIVVPKNNLVTTEVYNSSIKDWSNFYAQIKVNDGKAIYYAGFGWKKAGEFTSKEAWNSYLESFAKKTNAPLIVTIN